jgi:hypothetical protein
VRENVVRRVTETVATACVWLLAGCTSTVAGVAVQAPVPAESDGAIVALLDTGSYPTTADAPFGTAGSETAGAIFETHRMAENVVGPWRIDAKLRQREPTTVRPLFDARSLGLVLGDPLQLVLDDQLSGIAVANRFIAGFSSGRTSQRSVPAKALITVVMRFPDPGAAKTAASEMAAMDLRSGVSPRRPLTIYSHPEATASASDDDSAVTVRVFTAHGPSVLYQFAQADAEHSSASLTELMLTDQERLIDQFVPTDLAKLADLPADPTGQLLARTLWAPDRSGSGDAAAVWQPHAWLHFEANPIESAALFRAAGVDAVAQRLATVYRTHNAEGAAQVVRRFAAQTGAMPGVRPAIGIRGLPAATCFIRPDGWRPITGGSTGREAWHFKCIARADRYVFIALSDTENDVKQQISAQYRILAGK